MPFPRSGFTPPSWLRLPRRTARLRLTALYGGLFLLSGAALLGVTYLLLKRAIGAVKPAGAQLNLPASVAAPPGWVRLLQNEVAKQQNAADLKQLLIQSSIALAVVAVLAVVLGWLVAGRVLRPISTITAAARWISASNLHERLNLHGPGDELKALGDTLDELFARLEASFQAQRHFVANASHELRTPVTRERTMLQVALDDPGTTTETWRSTAREVLASNAGQEDLIEALLTLASSEIGLDQSEPVDLAAGTNEILRAARSEIGRLGLHVQAATQPAALDGDPLLVERLVANLVENAVRHNVPDGTVEISTGTQDGCAVLSVTNTGPVIPPTEVDRLFQPFQRLNSGRAHHNDGHGLGLSIVQAVATAHRATITAQTPSAGGLAITVTFPPPANPGNAPSPHTSPRLAVRARRPAASPPTNGRRQRDHRHADRPDLS
jgi:signal transduction histidine kinase